MRSYPHHYAGDPLPDPVPMPPRPSKGRSHKMLGFAIVFALVAVCILGAGVVGVLGGGGEDATMRRVPPRPAVEQVEGDPTQAPETGTAKPKARPAAVVLGTGTYQVAKRTDVEADEIAPGLWKISTPEDGHNCYWARLRNFDGELTSVRANGNVAPGKTAIITVKTTDKGLELLGTCEAKVASRS